MSTSSKAAGGVSYRFHTGFGSIYYRQTQVNKLGSAIGVVVITDNETFSAREPNAIITRR
jgi:hypothetical protein